MIPRRIFLSLALTLSWAGLTPAAERPHIILIMVDDMGLSDIGCYGGEIPTPHLDALAGNGVRFTQFYNTGRCCPTRATLLTGLYSHQAGIGWMTADQGIAGYRGQLNDECVTIAEVLGSAGYFTAMAGKWHVGHNEKVNPRKRGFQRSLNLAMGGVHFSNQTGPMQSRKLYLDGVEIAKDDPRLNPPWYGSDLWTEQSIKYLDESIAQEKPLFLYLAHVAPHFPCMAPEKTIAKYRGSYMAGWDELREQRHGRQIKRGFADPKWPLTPRPQAIPAWDSLSDESQKRYDDMMAIYAAMIDEVDKNVGKLVAALRKRDQLDNTLILFFSDNGGNAEAGIKGRYTGERPGNPHSNVFIGQCWAHLNNTPFRKYKHYNHEGGIATPLIAHWPDGTGAEEGGRWVKEPTHLIDIMATCVDLGDAKYPQTFKGKPIQAMEGTSLRPLFASGGKFPDRPLFWEHEGNAAVRVGDMKLVRLGRKGAWELYDLKANRTEQLDLAAARPKKAKELAKLWEGWANTHRVLPYPAKKKKPNKPKAAKTQ